MPPKNRLLTENEHFMDFSYDVSSYAEYGYEITVTLNPMIWSKHDCWKADEIIEKHLYQWLCPGYNPHHITCIILAKEYTKIGMSHYHIAVYCDSELTPEYRDGVIKGLQRCYGRSTFKSIINREAYIEYQYKDMEKNFIEKGYHHYKIVIETEL